MSFPFIVSIKEMFYVNATCLSSTIKLQDLQQKFEVLRLLLTSAQHIRWSIYSETFKSLKNILEKPKNPFQTSLFALFFVRMTFSKLFCCFDVDTRIHYRDCFISAELNIYLGQSGEQIFWGRFI